MPVNIVGMITATPSAEVDIAHGLDLVQPAYVQRFAKAHEDAGFDTLLVGHFTNAADGLVTASFATGATQHIKILLAHRPGLTVPSVAARQLATLDHFSNGRLAINIISGGDDADAQRDGDFLDHDARYRRTEEYLQIIKLIWTSATPVDFDGEFYKLRGASPAVRTQQLPHIPIFFGGSSEPAIEVAGRHADVYMTWGEPLALVDEQFRRVRTAAAAHGRDPGLSVSFRPIIADTEEAAWKRAHEVLERIREVRIKNGLPVSDHAPKNAGSLRLLKAAQGGEVLDERLWMGIATLTGARWNSTALVGTPEQVAESLAKYYRLGAGTLLARGFDPLEDAIAYGKDLIPLLREKVAAIDAERLHSAAA